MANNRTSGTDAGAPPPSRGARHAGEERRRIAPAVLIVAVALLAVGALLFAFLRPGAGGPAGEATGQAQGEGQGEEQAQGEAGQEGPAAAQECEAPATVTVSVTEEIQPVVQQAADAVSSEACADYRLVPATPDAALASLGSAEQRPDVWIADSQAHVERATSQNPELGMTASEPFAFSPVVSAMTAERASRYNGRVTWKYLFDNPQDLRIKDPLADTATLHALFSSSEQTAEAPSGSPSDPSAVFSGGGPMRAVLYSAANPGAMSYEALPTDAEQAGTGMYVLTEQQFARYVREHENSPLVAMAPAGGSVPLDYRLVAMPTTDPAVASASQALRDRLASGETAQQVREAGFRAPGDEQGPVLPTEGGEAPLVAMAMPVPDAAGIRAVISQWQSISSGLRLLVAIDTSGSMRRSDGPSGASRIELATGAALRGVMQLPPNTEVGVWEFSTAPDKEGNWREVVPLAPLVDGEGNEAQRSRLATGLRGIPATIGGDTPLYDTVLDAVLKMREGFDPQRINVVVVLTDGRNDAADTMNLSGLLKSLREMTVPGDEVPVATIAIGDEVDQQPLRQIVDATDGAFFHAEQAERIEDMMIAGLLSFSPTAQPGDPLP